MGHTRLRILLLTVALCQLSMSRTLMAHSPAKDQDEAIKPFDIKKPLIAYWNFDEQTGDTCHDSSSNGFDASPEVRSAPGFQRVAGLVGGALHFSGRHKLRVPEKPEFGTLEQISFSAWTMPTRMDRYCEIFRKEDGNNRVLFSYQNGGTILSLGLNINGYVECDAKIDPKHVLDGQWHHCVATFDGRFMRVYLDGNEIGSLERPGKITTGGTASGCIGSSNGGECFQGAIDELRIYRQALTPQEIAKLYEHGLASVLRQHREVAEALASFYVPGKTFAETLAGSCKNFAENGISFDRNLTTVFLAKLRASFLEDYGVFVDLTGATPVDYLVASGSGFNTQQTKRLIDMMTEYMPLTESQWKKQTPEQLRKWKEAERVQKRYEALVAAGDSARFSPEWIELMFEAGRSIDFRPRVSEAVAPYVTPETPETRNLTSEEARAALERDWLHQADNNPSPERIRNEITWARELAARIRANFPDQVDFSNEIAALAGLEKQAETISAVDRELYFKVRELKRSIAFKNPAVDFNKALFVDMPFPQGKEWRHETRHRLGYMAVPGARLLTLEGLSPEGKLTQLMPQAPLHGSFWRPDLSYDAQKVVFCFKPHNEKSFHLYEINIDGTGLVQLTDGRFDDFDPIYLPDGHILFSTTRAHTYVRCMPPTNAFILARCDADGKNVFLISRNNEPDYLPSVMNDGRILYTRWEYTDKPLWRAQGLWTVNADGTQVNTFWGNQSVWPDLLKDARNIPNSRRVMFTGSAHHNWFSGSVGIIDPDKGHNFPDGLTKVTADVTWPESGNGPVDPVESSKYHASGRYSGYYSPYPLGEQDFIVSADRAGKFVLYLMDVDGNRELIYEGVNNIFHASPLRPRRKPQVASDRVAWPDRNKRLDPKQGVIYSYSVYEGAPEVLRGKVKYLRVLNIEPKTYTYWHKRPYISTGPVVSIVQSEGVKRIIGTVPIEEDGSVAFYAPTGKALHFQLLDEKYRALQTMRSFTGVMPGERRGCVGCHEVHSVAPEHNFKSLAISKDPQKIIRPPWGDETVSYPRFVQPVLDKYCGKCHQGDGGARKKLDLTFRPGFLIFNEPYVTLTGKPTWGQPYEIPEKAPPGWGIANTLMVEAYGKTDPRAYQTPAPMTCLSYKSKLIDIASSGKHNDVKVDTLSLRKLIAWVDTMCPYRGDEEVREIPDPEFQGVDWLAIRPKIQNAPRIVRPGPVD